MKIDIDIEKRIVRAFFIKNSQPRLLHELSSKKRRAFTHRLSHQYNKYIRDKCMVDECIKFPSYEQFMDKMLFYGAAKESYVISEDPANAQEQGYRYCAIKCKKPRRIVYQKMACFKSSRQNEGDRCYVRMHYALCTGRWCYEFGTWTIIEY